MKKEILLYTAVSAIAWLVDVAVLYLLVLHQGLPDYIAAGLGYAAGLVVHYALSVRFVFAYRRMAKHWRTELLMYALTGVLGIALSAAIVHLGSMAGLALIVSKLIATVVTFAAVFTLRKITLFSAGKGGGAAQP